LASTFDEREMVDAAAEDDDDDDEEDDGLGSGLVQFAVTASTRLHTINNG